ncbi:hypothetical protein SAMN04489712_12822 [Thermomonospora echinospora]|uniref:Uncharacterized protein n=1 Tax=Thermomonospora echinospora TaxID=1992 RepID=A0A1H6E214_9ACTN|nr:hypothetical protein [Thermomonospora echinospora]SEG91046.1 hypothetical protein SAMN04489712_12822 [Thermomonospora echinospora]
MNEVDPAPALRALREQFPHWAFLFNPLTQRWFALRGNATTLVANTPEQLADYIQHIQPQPAPNPRDQQRPAGHTPPKTTQPATPRPDPHAPGPATSRSTRPRR